MYASDDRLIERSSLANTCKSERFSARLIQNECYKHMNKDDKQMSRNVSQRV